MNPEREARGSTIPRGAGLDDSAGRGVRRFRGVRDLAILRGAGFGDFARRGVWRFTVLSIRPAMCDLGERYSPAEFHHLRKRQVSPSGIAEKPGFAGDNRT